MILSIFKPHKQTSENTSRSSEILKQTDAGEALVVAAVDRWGQYYFNPNTHPPTHARLVAEPREIKSKKIIEKTEAA